MQYSSSNLTMLKPLFCCKVPLITNYILLCTPTSFTQPSPSSLRESATARSTLISHCSA